MMNLDTAGDVAVLRVSGVLAKSDYAKVMPQLEEQLAVHDKVRVMVVLDDFSGWTPSGLLEELKLDVSHRKDFEKVAVVGDKSLEELGTKITRPFFSGEVHYFDKQERDEAEEWLKS